LPRDVRPLTPRADEHRPGHRPGVHAMAELTLVQFVVALLMSLGGVCLFIWGVVTGLFNDVEAIKFKAYRAEVDDPMEARHD